jgi:heme/copper-type cytochrome/quinol oxidase subunit 1
MLATADHKRVGVLFLALSLGFLVVGGVLGLLVRAELLGEDLQLATLDYDRVLSMHATVSTYLFLVPAWLGLATFLVPLQIGSPRLAFPRLQAFSLWLFLFAGGLLVTAFIMGRPADLGLISRLPTEAPGSGADTDASLAIVSLGLAAVSFLLASMNLAVTVLKLRTEGLTLLRLPMFTWATLITSLASLLAIPVFLAGLSLLYIDQHFGGELFAAATVAGRSVWRHTVWLFGRPDIYLLALPGLGAACDIVATHAGRPLLRSDGARVQLAVFGILAFAAWTAGGEVTDALVLPTFSPVTALIAVPVGLLILLWLGTAVLSRPRLHPSLLFVGGFVGLVGFGLINVLVAAVVEVDGEAWTTGHLHTVAFGAPSLLLFAAIYHWAPKLLGRELSVRGGMLAFMGLFGGFLAMGLGSYLLGYDGAPAHLEDYPFTSSASTFSAAAGVGGVLASLGALVVIADLVRAASGRGEAAAGDPYGGLTLEWATASPPPPNNFDSIPEVRSAEPLLDLRRAADG